MSLLLYGVIMNDGQTRLKLPEQITLVPMRELCAVTQEGDYSVHRVEPVDVGRHLDVVSTIFAQDAVLPAPVGTVFRTTEVLQRWMDLHYVALSDALAWVEDRVAARVHMTRADGRVSDKEAGSDLAAVAADASRALRRRAVSTVPLRSEEVTGIVLSASYLVERDLWSDFLEAVNDERERYKQLRIELSGPWPPFDFVRMQFGA